MTVITNENIRDLVGQYFKSVHGLPQDLRTKPIGEWDVSLVTDMNGLFEDAVPFNEPIGNWNVSNVTDMSYMFLNALSFNQPIGQWNVSKVTNMSGMFSGSSFNQPIGDWDVSNVANMETMFYEANAFNQPIGDWDVSKVANMAYMFAASPFNQPIGQWNVSNVTNMSHMFYKANAFNQPIGDWDVSNVTSMAYMFAGSSFNQPIGQWDVANIDISGMFSRSPMYGLDPFAAILISRSGSLKKNADYNPALLPSPNFPVSENKLSHESEYFDFIDGDNKNVLDSLNADQSTIAFKAHNTYYMISKEDLLNVMNDANNIKYECNEIIVDFSFADIKRSSKRNVPYLSINSIGVEVQGVVSFFDLWTAIKSPHRAYELVRTARVLPSIASHDFLYGTRGTAGERAVSSAHCQEGQDANVYELRILPIDPRIKTATKIQSVVRGHMSRKKKSGGKKRSDRRKHVKHNKRTRKGSRMHKKMY